MSTVGCWWWGIGEGPWNRRSLNAPFFIDRLFRDQLLNSWDITVDSCPKYANLKQQNAHSHVTCNEHMSVDKKRPKTRNLLIKYQKNMILNIRKWKKELNLLKFIFQFILLFISCYVANKIDIFIVIMLFRGNKNRIKCYEDHEHIN
jgi:hypothetical protein